MIRSIVIAATIALAAPAFAQRQPPDPAVMQRAMNVLQARRNQAFDQAATAEVRAAGLADDLAKAQARIKELEPKPDAKEEKKN